MEIKSLPTAAGTMEGGLQIGQRSLRTTQSSVCVYINILLLWEPKERTERRGWRGGGGGYRKKGQKRGGVDKTGNKGKVQRAKR